MGALSVLGSRGHGDYWKLRNLRTIVSATSLGAGALRKARMSCRAGLRPSNSDPRRKIFAFREEISG